MEDFKEEAEKLRDTVQDLKDEVTELDRENKRLRLWNKQCEKNMEKLKHKLHDYTQGTFDIVSLNAKLQSSVREMKEGMEAVTKEKEELEHQKKVFIAAIHEINNETEGAFSGGRNFGDFLHSIMKRIENESLSMQ